MDKHRITKVPKHFTAEGFAADSDFVIDVRFESIQSTAGAFHQVSLQGEEEQHCRTAVETTCTWPEEAQLPTCCHCPTSMLRYWTSYWSRNHPISTSADSGGFQLSMMSE